MHINPYGTYAVQLGVDLVNDPPTTAAELGSRCEAAGLVVDWESTDADLVRTRELLADWVGVVDAVSDDERAARDRKSVV